MNKMFIFTKPGKVKQETIASSIPSCVSRESFATRIKTLKSNILNWRARVRNIARICEAGTRRGAYLRVEMVSRIATSFVKPSLPSLIPIFDSRLRQ